MKKIGIIGSGTIVYGIAEVCAIYGYEATFVDISEKNTENLIKKIQWDLSKLIKLGKIKDKLEDILKRIKIATELDEFYNVDYVIEAVIEDLEIKRDVFKKLDQIVKKDVIFASNTTTMSISLLAEVTNRQGKFIGLHFINSPISDNLIEIILTDKTSKETLEKTKDFVKSINKDYVIVKKDIPGFLINRINVKAFSDAVMLNQEGFLKEDIDAMAKFRLGFPTGFLELLDFTGIDALYYTVVEWIKRGERAPSCFKILENMVKEGRTGFKSGKGFYEYKKDKYERPTIVPSEGMFDINPLRILAPAINEAAWLIRNEICTKEDIEKGMEKGMNWSIGPLTFADKIGIDLIVSFLKERYEVTNDESNMPDPLLEEMIKHNKLGVKTGEGFFKWNYEMTNFGPVKYEKMHDFAKITMRRHEKLNALNEEMWIGLNDAFSKARNDNEIRAVVITGEDRAFCAGDDIEMMYNWNISKSIEWSQKIAGNLFNNLLNYPKPIVSVVNGLAFGGGMELNILFDIVISSDRSIFSIPEGLIGALPPIATSLGVALVNKKLARYALTGEWINAYQAKELGLVDIVVPHDQLEITMIEMVEKIKRIAPLSSYSIKQIINSVRNHYLSQISYATQSLVSLSASEDFKEGMRAFIEKRKPKYIGK